MVDKGKTTPTKIRPDLDDFQDPRKVFHHTDRVEELRRTGDTRPVHMTIGFTNYCNHKCPWCYINWNQAGKLSERSGSQASNELVNADEKLLSAIQEARDMGLKAVTIVGDGEPTLHPKFTYFLAELKKMGLDIGIFTNVSTKSDETLNALIENCFFVRGSIDAAKAETHQYSHGLNDFDHVINNVRTIIKKRGSKKYPIVGVQFVANHWNWKEIPFAAKFYRDLGVDYLTLKPAYKNELNLAHESNELDTEQVFELMREAETFSTDHYKVYAKFPQFTEVLEYKTNDARYYKKCNATPLSPYLDEDGNVEMCGNLKGRGFTMGNIYKNSFKEIWTSAQRRDCLSRIDLFKCPSGCKLDPLNKVLWDAFAPEEDKIHPNFI